MTGRERAAAYRLVKRLSLERHRPHELIGDGRVVELFRALRPYLGREELSPEELTAALGGLRGLCEAMRSSGRDVPDVPDEEGLDGWVLAAEVMLT